MSIIIKNPDVDLDFVDQCNLPGTPTVKFEYQEGYMFRGFRYLRKRTTFRLTWLHDQRSPDTEGHNGTLIGDWWPERIGAMRDRAHGQAQKGIAGKGAIGAVSICIGKGYENIDDGDIIQYCGDGTSSMDVSMERGTMIRVLRAARVGSIWAPALGIRYDGLYKIVGKEEFTNKENKKAFRYKLVRDANQKPFAYLGPHSRPTTEEMDELLAKKRWIEK